MADSEGTETQTDDERRRRYERGLPWVTEIVGEAGRATLDGLKAVSPELEHQVVAWGFGEIYSRPALPPRDRQLLTLGMLTALGDCAPQLKVHIQAALRVGLKPAEIVEAFVHSAAYCGFPKALNATMVAKEVFDESGLLSES